MRRRSRFTSLLVIACMCASMLALAAPAGANTAAKTELRLTDDMVKQNKAQVSGDIVVYRAMEGTCANDSAGNWDVYMYDLRTHQQSAVCTDPAPQNHPTISGDIIAWMDRRDDDEGDIWMYDLTTGEESAVCTAPYEQCMVDVGDGYITWVDWRLTEGSESDIYMKDLATGVESIVTSAPGSQQCVSATGQWIVWRDQETYPNKVGLHDVESGETTFVPMGDATGYVYDPCVSEDGRYVAFMAGTYPYKVYVHDRQSGETMMVPSNCQNEEGLAISGDRLVYEDHNGNSNVMMYDLSEATESVVASAAKCQGSPDISGNTVVWHDERWGIFMDNDGDGDPAGDDPRPEICAMNIDAVDTDFQPVAGTSRYTTAIQACQGAFPLGSDTVVLATGEKFPDALGGAALAGAYDAPILLTNTAALRGEVELEILRLGAKNAIVLGDENALSKTVFDRLDAILPGTVTRIGSTNRYKTANLIAAAAVEKLGPEYDGKAFVTTGLNYPDALAASPLAYASGIPVFLAGKSGVSAETTAAMEACGVAQSIYLGQSGVNPFPAGVSEGPAALRLGGADRYATAVLVAGYGVDELGMNWYNLHVATGQDFPDALAAGPVAGSWDTVMLLTKKTSLPGATQGAIEDHVGDIEHVYYMGGTTTIYPAVRTAIQNIFAY